MSENNPDQSKATILAVDDNSQQLRLLTDVLTRGGYTVVPAGDGRTALLTARSAAPDLIMLDIMMPDADGYEVCEQLKADEHTRDIPVIFVTVMDKPEDQARGFAVGGVDYVTKPYHPAEVLARVETHLALRSLHKKLQKANRELAGRLQELEHSNNELQARNEELEEAQSTIKTLSGIVPVCAWCHRKIRDKEGKWVNLESYIAEHSEGELTHGICPDCLKGMEAEI
jgi:PleD family two-component response regulator